MSLAEMLVDLLMVCAFVGITDNNRPKHSKAPNAPMTMVGAFRESLASVLVGLSWNMCL